jgi:hypothetical protein
VSDHCLVTKNVLDDKDIVQAILVCVSEKHDKKIPHEWSKPYKLSNNRKSVKNE